jgi:serine/threonine protein kinase
MATENERGPPSTEVSLCETAVDPQFSACAVEGQQARRAEADASSSTGRLAAGQLLGGRYRIERELGEGGMGVVYLAADEHVPGERFAIKVLKEELRPEALALLREEVRKTRKLSHPNIVDVHSVNVDGQKLYLLMEYLEGKSLDSLLDEEFGRGMSFSHAWPIIEDVGAALGNAHDHNVIHSDLKPANVFLTNSGRTKLLDFGIARASRGPLLHAPSGTRALTPAYASCEMLEGKEPDRRDDIYSFACVIYEVLCGERPFGDLTALEAREDAAQMPPLQGLSRNQNEALAQALAFDRASRTASVEHLLCELATATGARARRNTVLRVAILTAAALSFTYLAVNKLWISKRSVVIQPVAANVQPTASRAATAVAAFNPPAHSIAVLPFVNISGDKEQEYFSDGLTEELLNSLAAIQGLQVAGRTSSFSFKEHPDIVAVAHKLNVASVLEGSVRRSEHTVRVSAQLINAVTGFHLWSKTYDRDLGDVLKLQTEIATAVAEALKVTLLGDVAAKIELGGTRNPAAFDAYLRGRKAHARGDAKAYPDAIAAYTEAIRLDPNYALAFAGRSIAYSNYAGEFAPDTAIRQSFDNALVDAHQALARAPDLAEGYLALALFFDGSLDFAQASKAHDRARALAPGNAEVLRLSGPFGVHMGHTELGLAALRRAVVLDPLNPHSHEELGEALYYARRYQETVAATTDAISLDSDYERAYGYRGLAYYVLGDFERARASCEAKPDYWVSQWCLALTYAKVGPHAEAEARLAKFEAENGDASAYQYATVYAQRGNIREALEWLDTAVRVDPGVVYLKTDPLMDPLRKEPRFQAIERALKFPD